MLPFSVSDLGKTELADLWYIMWTEPKVLSFCLLVYGPACNWLNWKVMSQMSNVSILNVFSMLSRVNIGSDHLKGQSHQLLMRRSCHLLWLNVQKNSESFKDSWSKVGLCVCWYISWWWYKVCIDRNVATYILWYVNIFMQYRTSKVIYMLKKHTWMIK